MTSQIARQPQGVPSGGQFAPTNHAETTISLTGQQRPELDGWPKELSDPDVNFAIDENGGITTIVTLDDESHMNIWTDNESTGRTSADTFGDRWSEVGNDVNNQAEEWASAKHEEIEREVRSEMLAAANRARAGILAKATGNPGYASDDQLFELIHANQSSREDDERELACVALASRKILEDHPEATQAQLTMGYYDETERFDGVIVQKADRSVVATYPNDDDDADEVYDLVRGLTDRGNDSSWSHLSRGGEAFSASTRPEDAYIINLRKAAAWAPGSRA